MKRTRRLRVTTVRTLQPGSRGPFPTLLHCRRCLAVVQGLSFAQVELLLGVDEIGLLELVLTGSIHLVSSENGDSRICGRSLEGAVEP